MAMIFCYECGKKISETADCCPSCGATQKKKVELTVKRGVVALLLAWFLGVFGAHRFYVGKTGSAIAMLIISLTFVGLIITGIWTLVDIITIICGNFTDNTGKKISF